MRRRVVFAPALLLAAIATAAHAAPNAPAERERIPRRVPEYPASIMNGCTADEREHILRRIVEAIRIGVPTHESGDARGAYGIYDRAAREIASSLPASCPGPTRTLREAGDCAASAGNHDAAAQVMRDVFAGLLLLLERSSTLPPMP